MTPAQKRRAERRKHLQKKQPREVAKLRCVNGRWFGPTGPTPPGNPLEVKRS